MKTVLVHGYAGETRMSFFRPPLDETAGFYGFREMIKNHQAIAFPWGVARDLSFWQVLNPLAYLNIYKTEEQLVLNPETQRRFFQFLSDQKATTVIGHSLGCRLIYKTAIQIGLPESVKCVIWVQAGIDADIEIKNVFPELMNIWCSWDPTLLSSMLFLHFTPRAGLMPIQGVKNIFRPLWRLPNLHTSSQKDAFLLKLVH